MAARCTAVQIWPEVPPHGVRLTCALPAGHEGEHGAADIDYLPNPTTVEYGVKHDGHVIVGPGWASVADVMAATHGRGEPRAQGQLVRRVDAGPWEDVR